MGFDVGKLQLESRPYSYDSIQDWVLAQGIVCYVDGYEEYYRSKLEVYRVSRCK